MGDEFISQNPRLDRLRENSAVKAKKCKENRVYFYLRRASASLTLLFSTVIA